MIQVLFFFFAALAVGAAINVLAQKHVLYSSLALIVMLVSVSALFILLQAEFLAVINVIVYAGAIMVLFVFRDHAAESSADPAGEDGTDRLRWLKLIGIPIGLFLLDDRGHRVECQQLDQCNADDRYCPGHRTIAVYRLPAAV
jgi:NADH:ubiquinone oxidoreductase subunit 6 (subunit J)